MRRDRREERNKAEGEVMTVVSRVWEERGEGREGAVLDALL
jgi:hypothetical protein